MVLLLQCKKDTNLPDRLRDIRASETESPCLQSAVISTESSQRWAFHFSALDKEGLREALCLVFPSAVAWEIFAFDSS